MAEATRQRQGRGCDAHRVFVTTEGASGNTVPRGPAGVSRLEHFTKCRELRRSWSAECASLGGVRFATVVGAGPGATVAARKKTGTRRSDGVDVDGRPAVVVAYSEEVVLLPKRSEFGISRCEREGVLSSASGELGRWVERGDADATSDEIPMSSTVSGAVHDHNACGCRQLSRRRGYTRQARHDSASAVQRRGARDRALSAGQSRSRRSSSARAVLAVLHLDSACTPYNFCPQTSKVARSRRRARREVSIGTNTKTQSLPGKTSQRGARRTDTRGAPDKPTRPGAGDGNWDR